MNIRFSIKNVIPLFLLILSQYSYAGVVLGGTRVVHLSTDSESSLTLTNTTKNKSYLVQSWISDENEKLSNYFIITPPLFKLAAGDSNLLRIINTDNNLPDDRESMFWINVKSIPSSDKGNSNELQIVIKSRLKLFYRPSQLSDVAKSAFRHLKFSKNQGGIDIYNETPVFINLYSLETEHKNYDSISFIPPLTHVQLKTNDQTKSISWQSINDTGSLNEKLTYNFE